MHYFFTYFINMNVSTYVTFIVRLLLFIFNDIEAYYTINIFYIGI